MAETESEAERRERYYRLKRLIPSELDLCPTCQGKSDPNCVTHGISASNARQSEFYRRWEERHG